MLISEQLLVGQGRCKKVFIYRFKLEFYEAHRINIQL
jgi:hypothetical protein